MAEHYFIREFKFNFNLYLSPSLFQLPSTPQHSSTQFEWNIDEVSSLNPTNVEAHETQFISILDPEQEAKAQEAITNYFRDKLSVPSPIDCPLRNQKIILPSSKPPAARPTRNASAQTELTLPPILPAELEAALRPFFTFTQDQQQSPSKETIGANSTIDHDARDASLRRKLFDASLNSTQSNDFQLDMDDCLSPAPTSPEVLRSGASKMTEQRRSFSLSLSPVRSETDRHGSSFGSISPITRAVQSPSTENSTHDQTNIPASCSSIYQSTPGSSSASAFLTCRSTESAVHMSIDLSRTANRSSHPIRCLSKSFGSDLSAMLMDDDDNEDAENIPPTSRSGSSLSGTEMVNVGSPTRSSSSSPDSQHSGTPSRKLRRATRKNLSHSFSSSQFLSDESMVEQEALTQNVLNSTNHQDCLAKLAKSIDQQHGTSEALPLCQADSGFNEMEE